MPKFKEPQMITDYFSCDKWTKLTPKSEVRTLYKGTEVAKA